MKTGRHDASPSCPAASTASPQSTDEVPMTPKPDPSTTPPVRTGNRVDPAFLVKADRNSGHIYAYNRNCYWLVSCATAKRDPVCPSCAGKAVRS